MNIDFDDLKEFLDEYPDASLREYYENTDYYKCTQIDIDTIKERLQELSYIKFWGNHHYGIYKMGLIYTNNDIDIRICFEGIDVEYGEHSFKHAKASMSYSKIIDDKGNYKDTFVNIDKCEYDMLLAKYNDITSFIKNIKDCN